MPSYINCAKIYSMKNTIFRKATSQDINLVFEWANDPVTRSNSFNQNPIPYENHTKWFSNKLASDSCIMLILEADNQPVGILRLDIVSDDPKTAEISYSISPLHRGKGYGTQMIASVKVLPEISEFEIQKLIANVKESNVSSQICFEKAGYQKSLSHEGFLYSMYI